MESDSLRHIMAGHKTGPELLAEGKISIEGQENTLVEFFDCFETGDEFLKKKVESRLMKKNWR